ncbi:MAG: zinc-dependent metalloprotease, partial [Myxococcales bacterium]
RFKKTLQGSDVLARLLKSDEIQNAIRSSAPDEPRQAAVRQEIFNNLSGELTRIERRLQAAAKDNVWLAEFSDDAVAGLALELKKRVDDALRGIDPADRAQYEGAKAAVRAELKTLLKNRIFQAVTEHEVGHTVGLRHNFQGSFDALNYGPRYWELRKENLRPLRQFSPSYWDLTLSDMLEMGATTEAQAHGRMHEHMYASIMDYGARFNADIHGIGRYDEAAVLFAYGGIDGRPGPVEVFTALPQAKLDEYLATDFTARTALMETEVPVVEGRNAISRIARPSPSHDALLESVHYTRLPELFGDASDFNERVSQGVRRLYARRLVRHDEVQAERDAVQKKLNALGASGGLTLEAYLQLANERKLYEVPYLFCSDEWVGALPNCQRWDAGADFREQQLDLVQRYRNYYWFTNFKRDRYGWSSFSVLSRVASRYFLPMPNSYQHWLFSQFTSTLDPRQLRYWTLGVFEGFNLLNEVLATPADGAYGYLYRPGVNAAPVYRQLPCRAPETEDGRRECEDDFMIRAAQLHWLEQRDLVIEQCAATLPPQPAGREGWLQYYRDLPPAEKARLDVAKVEFFLPKGPGRPRYSRYDVNSGYYLYDKVLEAGSFWDQLAAIITLVQSDFTVLGVETQSDFRRYSIPYYLAFSSAITDTFAGIYLQDQPRFAPRVRKAKGPNGVDVAQGVQHRVPASLRWYDCTRDPNGACTGVDLNKVYTYPAGPLADAEVVERPVNWTDQIYAALYSMAFFTSASFSQDFADVNKVYRLGSGEALQAGSGYEAVTFNDPFRGHVFAAIKPVGVTDEKQLPPGALLITRANATRAAWEAAKARHEADRCDLLARDERDQKARELEQQID